MNLDAPVSKLPLVGPAYVKRLEKLVIYTIEDLIHHVPHRYNDFSKISNVRNVRPNDTFTVIATVKTLKNIYTRNFKNIQIAEVEDKSGTLKTVWYNQPYLARTINKGDKYSFSGKVDFFDREFALIAPDYEKYGDGKNLIHTGRLVPIYPETGGVSSKWLRGKINFTINTYSDEFKEFLPGDVLQKYKLIDYKSAIFAIHFPKSIYESDKARKRLAFNELLFLHLKNSKKRLEWHENKPTRILKISDKIFKEFTNSLPFKLTGSQTKATQEVLKDLENNTPMNRLLEGDVGSGKTVVAAAAAFSAFTNGYQTVFMAPTQILAQQHYETLKSIFDKFKVRVSLVTSSGIKSELGKSDIFVGTHALIHRKINLESVALVVIDEQHRFGVEQRAHLINKIGKSKFAPHVLTMTATPIPRTVALTLYGDLDLTVLTELPKGRQPITTWIVSEQKREGAYNWINKQIQTKKVQVYLICPLIEESFVDSMLQVKAATKEFEKIKSLFPKIKIGLLHGRQKADEKNKSLDELKKGNLDMLVATPVVEVGIDVPNATIIIIEAAERFGLAQLHQLRGRVGRGTQKSYCLLFTETKGQKVKSRLTALQKTLSGFELSELDLKLRGPGEMFGFKQHGYPELKIASWQDAGLISDSKSLTEEVLTNRSDYKLLFKKLNWDKLIHN